MNVRIQIQTQSVYVSPISIIKINTATSLPSLYMHTWSLSANVEDIESVNHITVTKDILRNTDDTPAYRVTVSEHPYTDIVSVQTQSVHENHVSITIHTQTPPLYTHRGSA